MQMSNSTGFFSLLLILGLPVLTDNFIKILQQKQDAMQKLFSEDRENHGRVIAEMKASLVKKQLEHGEQLDQKPAQGEQADQEPQKDTLKTKKKLFPNSELFEDWGDDLSEDDQKEAQALFKKYGYNVFLSDRLPLDRDLPYTLHPR